MRTREARPERYPTRTGAATHEHFSINCSLPRQRGTAILLTALLIAFTTLEVANAEDVPTSSESTEQRRLGLSPSTSAEYSQGKYGTGHTTQLLYVPSTLIWHATDRLDLTLTIPYIWEHGRDILASVGATSVWTSQGAQSRQATRRSPHARTEDGLGDILLEGAYVLLEERDLIPELSPFVLIKFPTADSSRGLGTGEFDEVLGINLVKVLGERWTAHLELSYTFVGSPPHVALEHSFGWSVGISYDVTPSLRLATYLEGATAVSRREQNPLDLRFQAEYKVTRIIALTAGASAGLSHGSADFGILAGIKFQF